MNEHEERIQEIHDKFNINTKIQEEKHIEEMARIKNEQLQIEKNSEIEKEKIKPNMDENWRLHEVTIQNNNHNHEVVMKKFDKEIAEIQEIGKLNLRKENNQYELSYQAEKNNFDPEKINKENKESFHSIVQNIFKVQYDIHIKSQYGRNKKIKAQRNRKTKIRLRAKENKRSWKSQKRVRKIDLYNKFGKKQFEINDYFNGLKFYAYIDSYSLYMI